MKKKYNKLECGCQYGVDNNEEVLYCDKHKTWDEVKPLVIQDIHKILKEMIYKTQR